MYLILYSPQVSATPLRSVLVEGVPTPPAVQMVLVCAAILSRSLGARSLMSRLTILISETLDMQVRGCEGVRQHFHLLYSLSGGYSTSGTCTHKIKPINSDMCQFRLDFEVMELVKPTSGTATDGVCGTDTLTIKEVSLRCILLFSHPVFPGNRPNQHKLPSNPVWARHRPAYVPQC
jgi:hypothetical protein